MIFGCYNYVLVEGRNEKYGWVISSKVTWFSVISGYSSVSSAAPEMVMVRSCVSLWMLSSSVLTVLNEGQQRQEMLQQYYILVSF